MTSKKAAGGGRLAGVLGLSIVLSLVWPAMGAEEYPAPGYFLDGLSEQSSWNEILEKPGVKAAFPFVDFGPTYVALSSVCADGEMLAISDPRIDTGVRVSAAELREQVRAAADRYAAGPGGQQLAATAPSNLGTQAVMRYPVSVYRVIERGLMRQWTFLFDKLWPIPACPAK